MNSIHGVSPVPYVAPVTATDIPLPRSPRTLDPAIASPLERALRLGASPLRQPDPVQLTPGFARRLEDVGSHHGPDLRMVLAEVSRQDRERELNAKLSQARIDDRMFAGKYKAIDKSQEASGHRLQSGITEGVAQVLGGVAETGAGLRALQQGNRANKAAGEKLEHQQTARKAGEAMQADRAVADRIESNIHRLEANRPQMEGQAGSTADSRAHDRKIDSQRAKLKEVNDSMDQHAETARKASESADLADLRDKTHRTRETAWPAIGRGLNAVLTGTGNGIAAYLKHEAEFDDAQAERMRVGNEMHQSLSKRLEDEAATANAGHRKTDDILKELTQAEAGAVRFA